MEKTRQMKILSIIALVVAIAGMTLGFAAFSTTLSISSSATVTPNSEDFKVVLSGSETDSNVNLVDYIIDGDATAEQGYCDGLNFETSNIVFTAPGQKVTYSTYIHNIGKYTAYLKELKFGNVDGTTSKKVCTADVEKGTSQSLVDSACEGIRIYFETYVNGIKFQHFSDSEYNYYNEIITKLINDVKCFYKEV
mgnify:CR=1 FL=1